MRLNRMSTKNSAKKLPAIVAGKKPTRDQIREEVTHRVFSGKIVGGTVSQMATYSVLFLNMPEPIFLLSPTDGTVLEANPAALSILQVEEGEILGRPLAGWAVREERKSAEEFIVSPGGSSRTIELRFLASSGKELRLELLRCSVPLADYGFANQLIARDVTASHHYRTRLEAMNKTLERISTTDEMTGLPNFRSFKEELEKTHRASSNDNLVYGLIFLDVDHFKKYNDRNGHPAGDQVLKAFGRVLRDLTINHFPARYGGEEFVVLCPKTTVTEAVEIAEKLRRGILSEKFLHGEHQPLGYVSASIGVAGYPEHGLTSEEVLKCADQALYFSKSEGRDRVNRFGAPTKAMGAPTPATASSGTSTSVSTTSSRKK